MYLLLAYLKKSESIIFFGYLFIHIFMVFFIYLFSLSIICIMHVLCTGSNCVGKDNFISHDVSD